MKKQMLVLAVAAAMAAPLAASAADVEIYGQGNVSFASVSNSNDTADASENELSITSHASRLGFKGSEDLGGGLSAVYQIEGGLDLDDNNGTFNMTSRNSFVGLKGDFGTVLMGRHDTPYKLATIKQDVFVDTYGDYTGNALDAVHDVRADNVLAYVSPDMNGFSVIGAYVTDYKLPAAVVAGDTADDNLDGTNKDAEDHQNAMSFALMYGAGPLSASLAYQSVDNVPNGDGDSADATKLGLGYKISDAAAVNFIYEKSELGDVMDQTNLYINGSFAVTDSTKLLVAYGQRGETDDDAEDGGSYMAIGTTTALSKTTDLWAQYATVSNDDGGATGLGDPAVSPVATDGGESASALAVGIKVKFSSK